MSEPSVDPLAEALVDAQDQLLALYELATLSTESLDRDSCLTPILDRAARILEADELRFEILADEAGDPAGAAVSSSDDSSAGTVVEVTGVGGRRGALSARRTLRPFGTADHKLLRAVGHMALGALHTAELHHEAVEQAIVRRDHDAASQLAQLAIPSWRPDVDGLSFFARSDPAKTAGGDLFTFATTEHHLHFVVGDVSGKGLPAAMVMTMIISAANAALNRHGEDPAETLRSIDSWVYDYLSDSGLFCTLVAGTVDARSGELTVANAGHSPVMHLSGESRRLVEATAPPIGVLPLVDTTLANDAIRLRSTDRFAVSSDGFSEQADPAGDMFGEQRLLDSLATLDRPAGEVGGNLFDVIDRYAGGTAQFDDRTLVLIDYRPTTHAGERGRAA